MFIFLAAILFVGCERDEAEEPQMLHSTTPNCVAEDMPYSTIVATYKMRMLQHEFEQGVISELPSPGDELLMQELLEQVEAVKDNEEYEEPESEAVFYDNLTRDLIHTCNAHPCIRQAIAESDFPEAAIEDMMLQHEGTLYSKLELLQRYENGINLYDDDEEDRTDSLSESVAQCVQTKGGRYTALAKWPKKIPYIIDKDIDATTENHLLLAMTEWSSAARNKISFKKKKNNKFNITRWTLGLRYFVRVTKEADPNCNGNATLGYRPWSSLNLRANASKGTCLHELGHVLTLIHEHQRKDRDNYVIIKWDNIRRRYRHDFQIRRCSKSIGQFDFESIMMYDSFTNKGVCIDPSKPTMTKLDGSTFYANRWHLSEGDKMAIQQIYK